MDRVSFMMRVKDGCQEEYIRRHREVWPEVMAEHRRAGIYKMAIYLTGQHLFLYMEVEDYVKAAKILNKSPVVLRWEEYMAPIMECGGDHIASPIDPYPASLPEVFFWEVGECGDDQCRSRVDGADSIPLSEPHTILLREPSIRS